MNELIHAKYEAEQYEVTIFVAQILASSCLNQIFFLMPNEASKPLQPLIC